MKIFNWIKYWRNSLADAESISVDIAELDAKYKPDPFDIFDGKLPDQLFSVFWTQAELKQLEKKQLEKKQLEKKQLEKIQTEKTQTGKKQLERNQFDKKQPEKKQPEKNQPEKNQLGNRLSDKNQLEEENVFEKEILISALSLVPKLYHTKPRTTEKEVSPFWISAYITSNNELKPGKYKLPLIPRKILEPVADKDIIFSSVEKVDDVFAKAEIDNSTWTDYISSQQKVFYQITGQELFNFKPGSEEGFFEVKDQWTVIPDELVVGASVHILDLYNYLGKKDKFPQLFQHIISEDSPPIQKQYTRKEILLKSALHTGQMNNGFGLSASQRKSLSHYFDLKRGDVLAVNGPPGTGKTTLIQSVIADSFVKSALTGGHPLITVASSTNNQAITNIIESFSKGDPSSLLEERWLPQLNSFALYMVSSDQKRIDRAIENGWLYHSSKKNTSSLFALETRDYLAQSKAGFFEKLKELTGSEYGSLKTARTYFQNKIKKFSGLINEGIEQWQKYISISDTLKHYKTSYTSEVLLNLNDGFFDNEVAEINQLIVTLLEARQKEPFYFWILSFLKIIRKQRTVYYQSVFHGTSFDTSLWDFSSSGKLQETLLNKSQLIKLAYAGFKDFNQWKNQIKEFKKEQFSFVEEERFLAQLDTVVRYQNFYHAVHYWEARWLEETERVLKENTNWKTTETGSVNRLRRFAMLTPCFVSTFHMLPKMMQYSRFHPTEVTEYLSDFIDLLIVDESGQVSPEIGVPSFYLAKKALVIGDNYQIEPVWNVDARIDAGNLLRNGLMKKNDSKRLDFLQKSGYMSSNGNLMKLAQKSCSFEFNANERGLLLLEHRRCLDEIIKYCNELVYDNLLKPLTTSKYEKSDLLPPMAFLKIKGVMDTVGTSKVNVIEANEIVRWIKLNESQIIDFIYQKELKESKNPENVRPKEISDLVGIITPFAAQKGKLKNALNLYGYQPGKFQYGTVHSLQGAEKDIVLFSSVYTSSVKSGYFFDKYGPNMLNVAVSRAKRSFIVAGDPDIFKRGNKKIPSSLLAYHIHQEVNFNLPRTNPKH